MRSWLRVGNGLKAVGGWLRCGYFAVLAAVLSIASAESASAQTTFEVDSVLTTVDIPAKVYTAATALGSFMGTILVVWLAFRLVRKALSFARRAV